MTAWSRTFTCALALAGSTAFSLSASATCKSRKCAVDVAHSDAAVVSIIVQYVNSPSPDEVASFNTVGVPVRHLPSLKAVAVRVLASDLQALASQSNVTHISLDHAIRARQATAPIGSTPEYTAEPINAPWALGKSYDGRGIGVAVIDSGVSPVGDLSTNPWDKTRDEGAGSGGNSAEAGAGPSRVVYSANFVPNETTTEDLYGHGTHVAGLIAGNGFSSTGRSFSRTFLGIAPQAKVINLRVLDANGEGSDSSVIAAIEAAIALRNTYNIRVINLSLGRPIWESYTVDPLCQAVEKAWKAGIIVVAAAGNAGRDLALNSEGYGTIEAPGNDPYVITVGAANSMDTPLVSDDVMASYSSKGPSFIDQIAKPDIIAPGNLVTSLLAPNSNLQRENPAFYTPLSWYHTKGSNAPSTKYFPLSGTSMATAVASGAIADLVQAVNFLTPDQVKALLMVSANKRVIPQTHTVTDSSTNISYVAHDDVFTQGAGYLDLQATINNALNNAASIPAGYALSPTAEYNPATGDVTLVNGSTVLWGRTVPAGMTNLTSASSVYGAEAFVSTNGNAIAWGQTVLWGRSDPQAFTALWGSTVLWGRGTADAATVLWGRSSTDADSTPTGTTVLWGR